MITITVLDVIGDTMATAELSDGRDLVAGLVNIGTPDVAVTVFNARGKRARIGDLMPGTDLTAALNAAVATLNG